MTTPEAGAGLRAAVRMILATDDDPTVKEWRDLRRAYDAALAESPPAPCCSCGEPILHPRASCPCPYPAVMPPPALERPTSPVEWEWYERGLMEGRATPPPALDVGRLREAIDRLDDRAETDRIWRAMSAERLTEAIAREYAATPPTDEPTYYDATGQNPLPNRRTPPTDATPYRGESRESLIHRIELLTADLEAERAFDVKPAATPPTDDPGDHFAYICEHMIPANECKVVGCTGGKA